MDRFPRRRDTRPIVHDLHAPQDGLEEIPDGDQIYDLLAENQIANFVWYGGELVALAGHEVEAVTRYQEVVRVRVAFGYEFTISSAEYDVLVEE